ncbi:NAD-dependent succinate-semialdehyde dehydrogenase [Alcaligenaceae bacterium LF4-65]|jgi:succinate-semialdehyde dehydrogenase/glutarate-semialdehyde dehydrogenase|uniref:NAD-dependent succinate-semialdehyde dehydrogenase n=1 Tax=Zwartia hollandica TaxID=324606 RepID=A0A953NBM0_9BURK|nr:NAD-dependent succinate-semialdehyde dehydrogenase [Zwartia hollandica]MBZ1350684.1 NAD-dependent succinate-semialdehyde dehydrogenase [Zwartia hollandica]
MDRAVFPMKLNNPELLRTQSYIDGKWVDAPDGAEFAVDNPATGSNIAHVSNLGAKQAEQAIAAASRAFPAWRARTAKERSNILRKWFDLIIAHTDDLARIMTLEQGKPFAEAKGEIAYGASFVEWFAEQAKRVMGDTISAPLATNRMLVLREPIGVCAAITPWNFPNAMITRKVAPAIAAGCTIVLKPAEQTPLSALALAVLAEQAGIPPGVLNIITADSDNSIAIGKVLCASPVVRKVTFTGSTPVGRILMQQSASSIKKMSLELGGHAPFIVFEDADLDAAIDGAMISKYRNAGQTCVCTNRFYVHANVYDSFVEKLAARVSGTLSVGEGFEDKVTTGPLIDDAAIAKVQEHVTDAIAKGAKVVTGGAAHSRGGRFYQPTVLANINEDMLCMREETFGPVAPVVKFTDEAEVIRLANNTDYGLASYFYSRDIGRIFRVAEALEYGMVGVNTGLISNEMAPFGGVKQSGLGREGSVYGMDDFMEMKYVCLGGI